MSLLSSERKKKHREVYTGRFTFSLTHRNVQVNQWYKKRPFIAWWPPSLLKRGKDLASCRRSFGVAFFRGSRERELKLFFFDRMNYFLQIFSFWTSSISAAHGSCLSDWRTHCLYSLTVRETHARFKGTDSIRSTFVTIGFLCEQVTHLSLEGGRTHVLKTDKFRFTRLWNPCETLKVHVQKIPLTDRGGFPSEK